MTKTKQMRLISLAISLGAVGSADAALLGDLQRYPDITLNNTYLIYDHDALKTYTSNSRKHGLCDSISAAKACIGQLLLVSFSSTLNSGPYQAPPLPPRPDGDSALCGRRRQ